MTSQRPGPPDIEAAGVVTFRPGREVLLVHRPKYDDWSFPKGKLERGEHATAAAVREVAEETGLHVRLGPPLAPQRYANGRRMKNVHYWAGRIVGEDRGDAVAHYRPNEEIDQVAWVPVDDAARRLSYPYDRETLAEAVGVRRSTRALVVLRHAKARSRGSWRGADAQRTLVAAGHEQAQRLVPLLAAYDVTTVVTSGSTRCVDTVRPYADTAGWEPVSTRALSEEDATPAGVARVVEQLCGRERGAVACTHRPVLPLVYDALGLRRKQRGADLAPAAMLVLHLRKHRIVAIEQHAVR